METETKATQQEEQKKENLPVYNITIINDTDYDFQFLYTGSDKYGMLLGNENSFNSSCTILTNSITPIQYDSLIHLFEEPICFKPDTVFFNEDTIFFTSTILKFSK